MIMLRGLGAGLNLGGLAGLNDTAPPPPAPSGFCWIPGAGGVSGHWERQRAGQPCAFPPPPTSGAVVVRDQRGDTSQGGVTVGEYKSRRTVNALLQQFVARLATRRHDTIMALYASDQVKACADVMGKARATPFCKAEFASGNYKVLDPIGVIVELGVPFSPEELGAGRLERVYTPTEDQRFLADLVVYGASQRFIANLLKPGALSALPDPGDPWRSPLYALLASVDPNSTFMQYFCCTTLSVQQLIDRFPTCKISLPNYSLNPDPPTRAELTEPGGLRAYYQRGGYILSTLAANGAEAVARASITWNTGYCACPDTVTGGGVPLATFNRAAGEGFGWDVRLTIGPQYKIRITPHDAPWWSEAASFVAGKLMDLAKFVCANREVIQQVNSDVLLKELCTGPDGRPCTKGAAGCTCTKPTTIQQSAVGVANTAMAAWCSRIAEAWGPKAETPFTPPPPPISPARWPLVVTGLLGAIVGGVVAARSAR